MSNFSPFDIINMVCAEKDPQWSSVSPKDYNSFLINRGISMFPDTVMLAAEMAIRHTCPVEWQFEFYKQAITPKKKRFAKWHKPEKDELVDLVMGAYQVNRRKAIAMSCLLDEEAVKTLKELTFRGGR